MDLNTLAVIVYILAILFVSGGTLSRKIMMVTLGNGLVLYGRRKERDNPEVVSWHARVGYSILLLSLSYNWWYDSIAVAGNLLGILGMEGYRTFIATYHALASMNAHGVMLVARILMTVAYTS